MTTELEHKIILDEMGAMYFKRNMRYLRLYMKRYNATFKDCVKYGKTTIQYGNTCTYMGETNINVNILCKRTESTYFFRESIPINNLELFKMLNKK